MDLNENDDEWNINTLKIPFESIDSTCIEIHTFENSYLKTNHNELFDLKTTTQDIVQLTENSDDLDEMIDDIKDNISEIINEKEEEEDSDEDKEVIKLRNINYSRIRYRKSYMKQLLRDNEKEIINIAIKAQKQIKKIKDLQDLLNTQSIIESDSFLLNEKLNFIQRKSFKKENRKMKPVLKLSLKDNEKRKILEIKISYFLISKNKISEDTFLKEERKLVCTFQEKQRSKPWVVEKLSIVTPNDVDQGYYSILFCIIFLTTDNTKMKFENTIINFEWILTNPFHLVCRSDTCNFLRMKIKKELDQ